MSATPDTARSTQVGRAYDRAPGGADVVVPLDAKYSPPESPDSESDPSHAHTGSRPVYWGKDTGWADTDIYVADRLKPGNTVSGPALIELYRTTVPIYAGQVASKDGFSNLIVTNNADSEAGK